MTSTFCTLVALLGLTSQFSQCATTKPSPTPKPKSSSTKTSTTSVAIKTSTSNRLTSTSSVQVSSSSSQGGSAISSTGNAVASSSSGVLTTSTSVSTGTDQPTLSLTETAPTVTTATGITSAAPPPASATTPGANTTVPNPPQASAATGGVNVKSTILVLVRSADSPYSVISGLQGYGIPYEVVQVPQTGFQLPTLNSSATQGNYGGIISLSELAYEYSTGWSTGISTDQYNQIYAYQSAFGVRFVRIDAYPQPAFGTSPAPEQTGCCADNVEQLISFTNATGFPTANIKTGATMSTANMYHYPAVITDSSNTWEVAKYAPDASGIFKEDTTAAVVNDFGGRQQMVWFGSWATEWSPTSNFLQHAYIHWMTRGLFLGARKFYLSTQVDDVHLTTDMYYPTQGDSFRLRPADLEHFITWTADINSRMPAGSDYFVELGHNGNGDIIAATNTTQGETLCNPDDAIYYDFPPDTPMEFQKPLGSGVDLWPQTPASYSWSYACAQIDQLANWFTTAANRDAFAHVSHTFTHLPQNNITYSDANHEIVFNQAWLKQIGISAAQRFSAKGLIPPAITGLHNGDALRAWVTNGIVNAVGDNSRPVLLSPYSQHWPLISNVSANGYAGVNIVPRWPTTIYWNCDLPACTLQEWIDTASGHGTFDDLLTFERTTSTRYLLGLRHDAYMFHQANLRNDDVPSITVGSQTGQLSILQAWVETIVQEMGRLTNWPLQSKKHDDLAQVFLDRMTRDNCSPQLSYQYSQDGTSIVAVALTTQSNQCGASVPVTFPGGAPTVSGSATTDQVGSEPVIMWATMSGSAVKFTLPTPVVL